MSDELFAEEKERLSETLSEDDPPNVAVVSEPYAGREMLVDTAFEVLGENTERVEFSSVADAGERADYETFTEENVCVEGCEYLYTRRIDGFEPLESFIDAVAESDTTFVASWNSYAWSYVEHATDVDDVFQEVVILSEVGVRRIADVLSEEYDVSEFDDDLRQLEEKEEPNRVETLAFDYLPFDLWRLFYEEADNVFERITARSGGNAGVARAVFENRTWEDEPEDDETELSYEDAFALSVVVTKEVVRRDVLETVVAPRSLEKTLRRLSDAGFVELDGERVTLRPVRLVRAVKSLERRNLVW
ncbi:MAG: hypothetical protein U5J64_01885 [Halobacteriales archaeon]|nr:hypothetical protein [Halobacteriales archaeon]